MVVYIYDTFENYVKFEIYSKDSCGSPNSDQHIFFKYFPRDAFILGFY